MSKSLHAFILLCAVLGVLGSSTATLATEAQIKTPARPNILLIVADDLGFTDLGSFGGEIETPHLDKLAMGGLRLTNFYTAPTCSPTRAMLLSGVDSHLAGLGNMAELMTPNQLGKPGYEGYLNFRVISAASLLKDVGYRTYMAGKWHLGKTQETGPSARGFDKSFALLEGGGSHFNHSGLIENSRAHYRENGNAVELPDNFYSSDFYTDRIIDNIESGRDKNEPFFAYLAYTAPHWPLQAPDKYLQKYAGKYDDGYEVLQKKRLKHAVSKGVIPEEVQPAPLIDADPIKWEQLSKKEQMFKAKEMEVYAAMVDAMDANVGRLVDYLERIGELDNTFIFFMSDNGPEAHEMHRYNYIVDWIKTFDNSLENMGKANSYVYYGAGWGWAGAAPFRGSKGFTSEGGIRTASFVNYPNKLNKKGLSDEMISVQDVMPTLLELARTEYPKGSYKGRDILPIKGSSFLSYIKGESDKVHAPDYVMGWELFGKMALRQGDWKILKTKTPNDSNQWQLYNLRQDQGETENLAEREPVRLKKMIELWKQYLKNNGVIIPNKKINY